MDVILTTISPVFLLISIGYLAVYTKFFPQSGVSGLTYFVNNIAAPILLFRAMLTMEFGAVFKAELVVPYYIAALSTFAASTLIARHIFKNRPGEAVSIGFSACFANTILIGLPIILARYGEAGTSLLFTIVAFHSTVLYTVGMLSMEFSRKDGLPLGVTLLNAFKNIVKQPLLIGIFFGVLGNLADINLPFILEDTTKTITSAVLPCALFGIGGALNAYKLSAIWLQASVVTFLKLIVQPLLTWVLLMPVLGMPIEQAHIFILVAAMPTGVNAFIFASHYQRGVSVATNAILISTVLGFFTIATWLWLLENVIT